MANEYKPYVGALAGYSRLSWTKDPTAVFQSFEDSSSSYLFGVQTGVEVPLTETLSFAAKYQFTVHDHTLDVQNVLEAIVNENSHNLLGGIKYEF